MSSKLNGAGYLHIFDRTFVPEEDAFSYALERIADAVEEEKQEFVEWFYSGNWIKED